MLPHTMPCRSTDIKCHCEVLICHRDIAVPMIAVQLCTRVGSVSAIPWTTLEETVCKDSSEAADVRTLDRHHLIVYYDYGHSDTAPIAMLMPS